MKELKVHIRHAMFCEFKSNKNSTEIAKKTSSVYVQGVITDRQVWNWFSKFHSSDTLLKDEPRIERPSVLDQEALRELVECIPRKSTQEVPLDLNISQSTICHHLKREEKWSSWAFVLFERFLMRISTISIVTSLLSRQIKDLFLENIITGNILCQCSTQKAVEWQRWISAAFTKGGTS